MKWTINNIPDLNGKTIIVTGGNSGLGLQAVKAFAEKGATVVMACRNYEKGESARNELLILNAHLQIIVMTLDLMDLSSVRKFAERFNREFERLDILLNNAGIMMPPYQLTKDGIESQQGTNHFGHFALTGLLLEKLKSTSGSRVVNVSSIAHKQGNMNFDNLLYTDGKGYSTFTAYCRSKLENLMFTFGLQQFFESNNLDIKAVVAHPGVSDTNLFNKIGSRFLQVISKPILKLILQPAEMGALPLMRAAVDDSVKGGEFFGPDGFAEMKGFPVIVQPRKHAFDKNNISKLWEFSEHLTGVKFN